MTHRQNKTLFAILALVFFLPCLVLSCEIAPDTETTGVSVDNNPPRGYDYILTEADVDEINTAFAEKHGVRKMNWLASTVEASERKPGMFFYFGKYGDTLVIWRSYASEIRCCFSLEGYEFNFYIGSVWFIKNGKLYYNDDLPVEGLMTADEAKEFYDDYIVNYLPCVRRDYEAVEFISNIEIPTKEEMIRINDAYDKWVFDKLYNEYISLMSEDSRKYVYQSIYNEIGYEPHRFFHKDKFEEYHYYGKIGGKFFIAAETVRNSYSKYESGVPGYNFVYSGQSSGPLVYVDGVLTEVCEAYQKGIVSEAEIKELHERYLKYYYYFAGGKKEEPVPSELKIGNIHPDSSPMELTEEEKRSIVWEYIDSDELQYTYGVRCYGKFDGGVYAVMIDGPYMYTQSHETERVANYEFEYANSQKIKIYKDGVFYSMNEAYLMGIISISDVASIQWEKTAVGE